jgi:uncharacterized membrane protein YcjF (UPF0283 family)
MSSGIGPIAVVLVLEAILLNFFQKSVTKRNHGFAIASIIALIAFMVLVNVEWFKQELRSRALDIAKQSTILPWLLCLILFGFLLGPRIIRENIQHIYFAWNKVTYNLLTVLVVVCIIFTATSFHITAL